MFKILYVAFPEQLSHIQKLILHSRSIVLINKNNTDDTFIVPFASIIQ
jgi:hypothetical protein